MMPHPTDRYELEKTRQHQVWETAEQDRRAREVAEKRKQRTTRLLPHIGARRSVLAHWLKALRKLMPAFVSRRIASPAKAPARKGQEPAASALDHPCLQPPRTQHPRCA